jgi:hypothetical protein
MAHPAGIRTEADMWRSFLERIDTDGLDYALFTDHGGEEITAIDTTMRTLVQSYRSSRDTIEHYLAARRADPDITI